MSTAEVRNTGKSGIYLSPVAQRRADFGNACGGLFDDLQLADGAERALARIAAGQPDLLVIDLDRFEPAIDLAALGELVARRGGAPTLLLCPYATARWVPALAAFGPVTYAVTPIDADALQAAVAQGLAGIAPPSAVTADAARLRALLALHTRVQAALRTADDIQGLAEGLCRALAGWPGVRHAALFHRKPDGDLQLEAQAGRESDEGAPALALQTLLGRPDRLLQAPLRHAFPGLLAAATGELVLLDTLDQAGEPDLAALLRTHGVAMALGIAIPADGPGAPRGALSLLWEHSRALAPEEFAALQDVAAQAALGLRLAEMALENEQLLARVTYISTMDALTGVANRRHGEELLEKEIRRARRYRVPLALVAFDIDRFKAINERYGDPVGDVVLRSVCEAAQAVLRGSDVLVRSGGEEFQILAPHTSAIDALKMAEKLRVAIAQAEIPGADHVTVSLGVAQLGEQESADSLVQRVNAALARAKRAGRNCVELAMQ
ncbi:GGDEF domain-containing response regulator [Massilia phyllosphaerae]|uniref:GGDEF domain-containing response regulator n=1 Tax=Massilia phyllosphaerae TaxID=3106034 RepID=UPI002B1CDC17|nr:GGDEF domain-containing protein [Massilia sp. SGZ-792]